MADSKNRRVRWSPQEHRLAQRNDQGLLCVAWEEPGGTYTEFAAPMPTWALRTAATFVKVLLRRGAYKAG